MNKLRAYAKYIFGVRICEYWRGKFWQIAHDSPNSPIFSPAQNFPVYGMCMASETPGEIK